MTKIDWNSGKDSYNIYMKSRFRKILTILFVVVSLAIYALQMLSRFKPELVSVEISYTVYFILIALYAIILDAGFYFKYREIYLKKFVSTVVLAMLVLVVYVVKYRMTV